jgi:hypothetical protein
MPGRSRTPKGPVNQGLLRDMAFTKIRHSRISEQEFRPLLAVASGFHDFANGFLGDFRKNEGSLRSLFKRAFKDHVSLEYLLLGRRPDSTVKRRDEKTRRRQEAAPLPGTLLLQAHGAYLAALAGYITDGKSIPEHATRTIEALPSHGEALATLKQKCGLTYPEMVLLVADFVKGDTVTSIDPRVLATRTESYRQAVYAHRKHRARTKGE